MKLFNINITFFWVRVEVSVYYNVSFFLFLEIKKFIYIVIFFYWFSRCLCGSLDVCFVFCFEKVKKSRKGQKVEEEEEEDWFTNKMHSVQ